MKHLLLLINLIFILLFSLPTTAENVVSISINEPTPQPTISAAMLTKNREAAVTNADALLHEPDDVVVGNPKGSTTLIQFVDFLCPQSERMDPAIQALIKANPDLRVVYKPYPLRGTVSFYAVEAAWAAYQQGKYLPFHILLMQQLGNLNKDKIMALAKTVGLNIPQLQAAINDKTILEKIHTTRALADKIGIIGTPILIFTKTNLSPQDGINLLLFMVGKFNQTELQNAVNYINNQN